MEQVQILRIVVASAGDVHAERDTLPAIVEELNHGIAGERGLRLELARWETDAYPGFHPEGPQGLIDAVLRIEDCDILLGIFWKRFGTPTQDAQSGTEHEFRRAYEAWQQYGRPHIMVYFNQKAATPKTKAETDQWGQVLEFQRGFPKQGLWWPYRGTAQFEKLVRTHLTRFIRQQVSKPSEAPRTSPEPVATVTVQQHGSGATAVGSGAVAAGAGGVAVGGNVYGDVKVGAASASEPLQGLRDAYLTWLTDQVRGVPLTGVDPKSIREETRRDLDLAAVYTALMTQRTEASAERDLSPEREARRLSALAVLNTESHLALLGEPGSGKSTFVNFVALCLAGELLGRPEANLHVLIAPLPEEDEARRQHQDEPAPPQPWDHGPLMPVRVILREFVARGLLPAEPPVRVRGDTLWNFIIAELPETLRDFARPLRDTLLNQGGMLLLDGLDEVPEADQRRVQVKTAVEQFAAAFPRVRVLATSRTYAYQRQDWKLDTFAEAVLAPFGPAQMQSFIARWYAYVGQVRSLSADEARGRAALLTDAIMHNPRLYELAARPLLLTLMASLHAWRGGTLPDQRQELYADAVDLLLDQWESQKVKRRPDGTYEVIQPSLVEWLCVDQKAMRQLLNRLAFEAHRDQPTLVGTADIAQEPLVTALMRLQQNPDVKPARLIEYLRDRAGLLEPRGVEIYTFPHRTFQEYLAACHLTDVDFPDALADLLRAEPNRWREVTLLAGAKAVGGTASAAWTLADALCFAEPPEHKADNAAGYWGALLAAQVLIENNSLEHITERNRPKVARIRTWLVHTLRHAALPAVDRAQAGDALARLSDPRFRLDAWYLPDEPLLGFVEIPEGPFQMGSNKRRDQMAFDDEEPQHQITLPRYYMARYPVTVAQFRAFVEASGHEPEDEDSLRGLPSHPVVNVTWYDALAYCDWLTERLRAWEATPEPLAMLLREKGWRVTLPSEAEWEKAARGTDGRTYPWGADPNPNRANYDETGINTTSAVGCFPGGASPYEIQDLIGNVWEWTRSLWGTDWRKPTLPYPYNPDDGRENLQAARDVLRVLRGGSFLYSQGRVRCACRLRRGPYFRGGYCGVRVVVLPCL
jgi:formylglycine-generating enzyme required for sulfatase activity